MNKAISAKQLMYCIAAFIMASSLLTSNLYYFVKNDSWISVIIGYLASLAMVWLYYNLSRRYPGCSLIEINDAVFGKVLGKAVSVMYIFYFISLCCFNTRDLGDFVAGFVLQETPLPVVSSIFVIVCAWAVRKGPIAISRYGFLAAIIVIAAVFIQGMFLINRYELSNLLPAFTLPVKNYMIGAHIVTMLPFCEIMSFMMFVPYMGSPGSFGKTLFRGLTIGAVTLLFAVIRDIVVLGKFIYIFSNPTFSTIRYIDIGDILTRLEIVYAVILMCLLFFKVSIAYFAAVSGISRLVHIENHSKFVNMIGVLIIVYAAASFSSQSAHVKWNMSAAPTYSTLFLLVIPLITLIVSIVRGKERTSSGSLIASE